MARTTEELLSQHLSGSEAAASALVSRFRPIAAAAALRACGDRDLAEDAAQEALVTALSNVGQLRKPERFGEWLGTIARNEAYAGLRRRRDVLIDAATREPGPEVAPLPGSSLPGNDESFETSDTTRLTREAISRLPGRLRQVLELRYFHGCSYQEIAREVGIPVTTAKSRLQMARDLFREWYDELDTCEYSQEHLESFLAGRLPFDDAWEVHNHVFLCDHCLQRMLELSAVRAEVLIRTISSPRALVASIANGLPWEWRRLQVHLEALAQREPHRAAPWLALSLWAWHLDGECCPGYGYDTETGGDLALRYAALAAAVEPDTRAGLEAQTTLASDAGDRPAIARLLLRRSEGVAGRRDDASLVEGAALPLAAVQEGVPELVPVLMQRLARQAQLGVEAAGPSDRLGQHEPSARSSCADMRGSLEHIALLVRDRGVRVTNVLRTLAGEVTGHFSEQYDVLARRVHSGQPGSLCTLLWHPWRWGLKGDWTRSAAAMEAAVRSLRLLRRPSGQPYAALMMSQNLAMLAAATSDARYAHLFADFLAWAPPSFAGQYTRRFLAAAPGLRGRLQRAVRSRLPDMRSPDSRGEHLWDLLGTFRNQGDVPERFLVRVAPETRALLAPRRGKGLGEGSADAPPRRR